MKTKYLLTMIIAVGIFSIAAQRAILPGEIAGTWKYTISDVPPEYESGFMTFEQKEGKTTGYTGQTEKEEMKDLIVNQEKISFAINSQVGLVKYSLIQKGDTLSGAVSTQYGDFPIIAVKEAKK